MHTRALYTVEREQEILEKIAGQSRDLIKAQRGLESRAIVAGTPRYCCKVVILTCDFRRIDARYRDRGDSSARLPHRESSLSEIGAAMHAVLTT
jgi:hypothetical protein